jgi:hypothetical protein
MNSNRIQSENQLNVLNVVRTQLENDFATIREQQPRVLRLALNEAEALAMQTEFPALLFPTLATEKAETLERWIRRQSKIRRREPVLAFAV